MDVLVSIRMAVGVAEALLLMHRHHSSHLRTMATTQWCSPMAGESKSLELAHHSHHHHAAGVAEVCILER
jgi:hypothetical protein